FFSLAGGLFSLLCMAAVKRTGLFDCVGVSLVGGIAHNLGQIVVAVILVENVRVAYYFILLAMSGLAAGVVIGLLSGILVRRLAKVAPNINNRTDR
ncbi:MAG: Gx transporter family protein, partial [Oscillospiraceae bacterium]|nr:Gx transporter family protein [Oscillospiraceae bacterium]